MNDGIVIGKGISIRSSRNRGMIGFGPRDMGIRSYGKIVVPGTTDRNIWVANRDNRRGIVADDSIRSAYPDPWSRIYPDYDGCILAGAGTNGGMIIIKDIGFEVIDDLVNDGIVISQVIRIRSSRNPGMIGFSS